MPKQKRWAIKAQLDKAEGNINTAIDHIVSVGHEFEGVHDDYYQAFCAICKMLDLTKEQVKDLRDRI